MINKVIVLGLGLISDVHRYVVISIPGEKDLGRILRLLGRILHLLALDQTRGSEGRAARNYS